MEEHRASAGGMRAPGPAMPAPALNSRTLRLPWRAKWTKGGPVGPSQREDRALFEHEDRSDPRRDTREPVDRLILAGPAILGLCGHPRVWFDPQGEADPRSRKS